MPEDKPVAPGDPTRNRDRPWISSVLNMGNKFSAQSWFRGGRADDAHWRTTGKTVVPIYIDDAIVFGVGEGLRVALAFLRGAQWVPMPGTLRQALCAAFKPGNEPTENHWIPSQLGRHAWRALPYHFRPSWGPC